ncbi:MAG TPA: amino acid racemase [Vicinamibacterales bacterium]|nr:amino acid racemase [Vicinamibacterales bacterium]
MTDGGFLSPGQRYLPGIYGGVGPLSHTLFEQLVLEERQRRGARADQDHPVWLLASASSTPNRMRSLSGEGAPAAPYLRHFARLLEAAGADVLFVVCNTAHAYHEAVQRDLRIPWVHLMNLTVQWIRRHSPEVERVGVLGTDGTLETRLYELALARHGLRQVAPAPGSPEQRGVMAAIFEDGWGIKATGARVSERARSELARLAGGLVDQGAEVVIPACTEVSVGLTLESFSAAPLVDPLQVAAEALLDVAYGIGEPEDYRVR